MKQDFMIATDESSLQVIDLKSLSFEQGAHLLIKKALAEIPIGARLGIRGSAPELPIHLRAWCRAQGHDFVLPQDKTAAAPGYSSQPSPLVAWVTCGSALAGRWRGAQTSGAADPKVAGAVLDHPPQTWGLAARGAKIETGGPEFYF